MYNKRGHYESQIANDSALFLDRGCVGGAPLTWPLLLFLHGSGDRGDNVNLLAKASPFMMIREKGPLPFIIVAPLLNASQKEFALDYLG